MLFETGVQEVQIYRSSATVTRSGEADICAGRNLLFIRGMTESAKEDSFQLKFPQKIRAVNIQVVAIEDAEKNLPEGYERKSGKIEKQMQDIRDQMETIKLMLDLRKKNGDFSGRTNVSAEEQEKLMRELPGQLMELHGELNRLADQETKLKKEYDRAEEEEKRPIIMAELEAEEGGRVPFMLRYQDSSCSWRPKYEIQYKDDTSPLEVSMKAQIMQSTGEDWKQVKVTLYTGNPSLSNELPSMYSLQLSLREPPKLQSNRFMAGRSAVPMEDGCVMGASMDMDTLAMEEAEVLEEETMKAFRLPDRRDILNDTAGNIAELQSFSVKANYHVFSVPSTDDKCYLTAEIAAAEWPLPPANAGIYLRDTYAGEVYVNPTQDTELLLLSLGQDERLTVVRTESPKKTQETFLKGSKKQLCKVNIRLVNNSSDEVKVLVRDQIPVSLDKSLVVEATELSDGLLEEDTGEIRWELKARPGKAENLDLEYTISWPKDKVLVENRKYMQTGKRFCPQCGAVVLGKFCPECGTQL